jgi:hypothetical protein
MTPRQAPEHLSSPDAIIATCDSAIALAPPDYPQNIPTPRAELGGETRWHPFEHEAWRLGELIRQSLVLHPELRREPSAMRRVLDVVKCRNLGSRSC